MEKKNYQYKKQTKNKEWALQNPTSFISPRFSVDDPAGYIYLEENGYVVFKDVANEAQIEMGKVLAWDFLENLGIGVNRNDPQSWDTPKWPDPFGKGIVASDSVGHCELLWMARGIPNVKQIFANIWKTNDLISSFDGFCLHRAFEYNKNWKSKGNWYHLDQNGHHKPTRLCIQGFLNFYPCGPDDGGLVVIPKSHTIFNQIFKDRPFLQKRDDWIVLATDAKLWDRDLPQAGLAPIKVCCEPGDFVLWDSRTIHTNAPANTSRKILAEGLLPPRRLVTYICMTPTSRLTDDVRQKRIKAYQNGWTTTHWPEECNVPAARRTPGDQYHPIQLTPEQKQLIPLQ